MSVSYVTIAEIINKSFLDKFESKILLAHVLKFSKVELITKHDYILTEVELAAYNRLAKERSFGMPMAYIVGHKEFYSRNFKVTSDTLIPRPETELIIAEVLTHAKANARVLDLGTGSGCIAITCKLERPDLEVTAIDKFAATLKIASTNALNLGANVNFIQSDWFSNVTGSFDIIVSNPPYIEKNDIHLESLTHEPQHALTDNATGLTCYQNIIKNAKHYLAHFGYLIFEHGFEQKDAIVDLLQIHDFIQITTIKDYADLDRITSATY